MSIPPETNKWRLGGDHSTGGGLRCGTVWKGQRWRDELMKEDWIVQRLSRCWACGRSSCLAWFQLGSTGGESSNMLTADWKIVAYLWESHSPIFSVFGPFKEAEVAESCFWIAIVQWGVTHFKPFMLGFVAQSIQLSHWRPEMACVCNNCTFTKQKATTAPLKLLGQPL